MFFHFFFQRFGHHHFLASPSPSRVTTYPTMAAPARELYENPLVSRYASKEMSYIWSPAKKFSVRT